MFRHGLICFILIYWIHVLKTSQSFGATALTVMAVSGSLLPLVLVLTVLTPPETIQVMKTQNSGQ